MAGFAAAEVTAALLAALYADGRGQHALQHFPQSQRLVVWIILLAHMRPLDCGLSGLSIILR
ncbi:hypothetical protein D3C78_1886580 [compost metagenome]